jgi:hypothetical protein
LPRYAKENHLVVASPEHVKKSTSFQVFPEPSSFFILVKGAKKEKTRRQNDGRKGTKKAQELSGERKGSSTNFLFFTVHKSWLLISPTTNLVLS